MSTIRILLSALVAALTIGAAVPSQESTSNCPHQGVRPVPSRLTYGPLQRCGTSVGVRVRGVTLHNPLNVCPLFTIYEPPHDTPTPKQGFRTRPDRMLPIVMIKMECSTHWLFGFIPIPIGSSCRLIDTTNVGWVQNYVELACNNDKEAGRGQ